MKSLCLIALSLLLISIACSAQTAEQKPLYFPMKKGNDWTYHSMEYKAFSNNHPSEKIPSDISASITYRIADTASMGSGKYFVLRDQNDSILRLIRFDRSKGCYYSKEHLKNGLYSPEKIFLKNRAKAGDTWMSGKIRFKVASVAIDTTIGNTLYKKVIEVEEYIPDARLKRTIVNKHWYAEGFGEIAFYLSFPFSHSSGDRKYELSDYPGGR